MDTAGAPLMTLDVGPHGTTEGEACVLPEAPLSATVRPAADAVGALAFEWARLALEAAEPNAFAEAWFVSAGLRHLASGQQVRLVEVRRGPLLIGLLPLVVARRYGRMPVRNVQNWGHFHSFLATPLVRAGYEQAFWICVLETLDRARWAAGFLHLAGLPEEGPVLRGLAAAATTSGRRCEIVHRVRRAMLQSTLSPQDYYERNVRKKKRKEIKRLQNRLAELGKVEVRTLAIADEVAPWCDAFLGLERGGWKGAGGSALASRPESEAFFREVVAGARAAGRLDFLRLDLDGRPIAMLVNFITPPGSFSFKIAFDEEFSRFSPGVLLELENLRVLARPDVRWMDSCAAQDHPMINSLWAERRPVVRVSVSLAGLRRKMLFRLCRAAEGGWASLKRLVAGKPVEAPADAD